jgi:hypothetical protein
MCYSSIPNTHQPPQLRTQPPESKIVEKRKVIKFITQIAVFNFISLVLFGSMDSVVNLVVHCFNLQFMVFRIFYYSSLLFEDKFQIFVFMGLYAFSSLSIIFHYSTDYTFFVALFAWLLTFIVILFPKSDD